nr:MAG TPA: hypothetical protein [Bacteriophage sp.]
MPFSAFLTWGDHDGSQPRRRLLCPALSLTERPGRHGAMAWRRL